MLVTQAVFLVACSGVGDKNLYLIEKLYFDAEKLQEKKLGIKPELLTETDYDELIKAFMSVVNTYELHYGSVSEKDSITSNESKAAYLCGKSLLGITRLYQLKGDEEKTIELLDGFCDRFPHNQEQKALALLQLGRIEEKRGDVSKAESVYLQLLDEYFPPCDREFHPTTDVLELPVKLAKLFRDQGDTNKSEYFLDYAEEYYRRIIEKYRYSPLGITTARFLADTYVLRNKPAEAVSVLEAVTDSTGKTYGTAQLLIADIYISNLGDTAEARRRYEMIVDSEADTVLHPKAYMQLAKLQFMEDNFIECRKYISIIKTKFERYPLLLSQSQQLFARTFEMEGDFNRAFSEYKWLLTNFPESKEAIETYRHLPGYLKQNEQYELAEKWYQKAADFLSETRDGQKGTILGLTAQSNLINVLVDIEQWDKAVSELQRLQSDYPRSIGGFQSYLKAGNICRDMLKDTTRAREQYEQQLRLYPDLPISEEAKKKLNELS